MVNYLFIICFSLMFTKMIEPLQKIKEKYNLLFAERQTKIYRWIIVKLFNCSKCFSFWLTLGLTHSLLIAVIISVTTELINRNLMGIRL